jgi:hypothetical protein
MRVSSVPWSQTIICPSAAGLGIGISSIDSPSSFLSLAGEWARVSGTSA